MSEAVLQKKIIAKLEAHGAYVIRISSSTKAGEPDIVACYKGLFLAIEVKRPKKYAFVELQKEKIRLIREAGGFSIMAKSVEEVEGLIWAADAQA